METIQRQSGGVRRVFHRSLLAVALVAASFGVSLTAASPAQAASTTMCSTSSVPAGWLVTEVQTNAGAICGPYLFFRITNDLRNGMYMCSVTQPPAGWVVTEVQRNAGAICGPYLFFRITSDLRNGMYMCSVTQPPAGWVVTEVQTNAGAICGPYLFYRISRLA
ncbi:hypothetical protein GA0070616_3932 [Micromonospora nigra]|uniref:Ig-like domain-containing protein n=1 Tax=Micromonospora nigra TaxID=145857 RepID=A0A1C6SJJ6_9ACTN|nr:hypothetical protein GA0070616_3932 [Micromonospora nigra]